MLKQGLKLLVGCLMGLLAVSVSAQEAGSLNLFVERDALTLYVAVGPAWLGDLEFRALNAQGVVQSIPLRDGFDVLAITGGYADAGTCFVYRLSGATPPLQDTCSLPNRVFRRDVTRADLFWYDFVTSRARTVIIYGSGAGVNGEPCPPDLPDCPVAWSVTPAQVAQAQAAAYDYRQGNAAWTPVYQTFDGVEMALVPPGCFMMGSENGEDNEKPAHQQCFDALFWISRTEVTNAQYKGCVEAGACEPPGDRTYYDDPVYADHPVLYVDWFQAAAYAGCRGGALPTEREWEYAARGPDGLKYPWGNAFDGMRLNFCDKNCTLDWRETSVDDGYARTAPVGSYANGASWVGALDMSGNVWEWTNSLYEPYPYDAGDGRETDTGDRTDVRRVLRGGSWYSNRGFARAASRYYFSPNYRSDDFGFRVVLGGVPS